ncbi:family 4 glycosyl hydrolase [Lacticaseibacillus daqingensis]
MKQQVVTIAGGGSSYTPGIIQAILDNQNDFAVSEFRLYDIDAQRNDDMYTIIKWMLNKQRFNIGLTQTNDPEVAFTGADFVFSQIRVGGIEMRKVDEKVPLKYGLVGQETCGLGGFSYGLRTIGPMIELVGFVQRYAPDAWILNYTNPESIVAETIRRTYPKAKMLNACDMTISIETTLCENYGYDRKNWIQTYYGLNHFGWYKSIFDTSLGRDVMPEILDKLKAAPLKEPEFHRGDKFWAEAYAMMSTIVTDFPDNIPNNYLEYYLYPDAVVEQSDIEFTRADAVELGREKEIKETAQRIRETGRNGELNHDFGAHGQYIVDMAVSILNNLHRRFMLIFPNMGAIPNLRQDAVVEVPAYVGATGAEPISLRQPIPDMHKGMMEAQVAAEKLLVDAYFDHSYQKALEAFTLNQTFTSARKAKQVLDALIEANGDYWPELR